MKIKWLACASLIIKSNGKRYAIDPFYSRNKKNTYNDDVFKNLDSIFVTHSHFDHLFDVPRVIQFNPQSKIFCTKTSKILLEYHRVDTKYINVISPKKLIKINDIEIIAHKASHCENDIGVVLRIFLSLRTWFHFKTAYKMLDTLNTWPLNGDIYAYELHIEGKKILIFGSAGIDNTVEYPNDVDLLILAYQGKTNMRDYAFKIIELIHPKAVMFDHFDNAFPPITHMVKTDSIVKKLHKYHPEINVIVPTPHKWINF